MCFIPPGFLVETVQSNPHLLNESSGSVSHRCLENTVSETSIPVPVLNWPNSMLHTDSAYILLSAALLVLRCFIPLYFLLLWPMFNTTLTIQLASYDNTIINLVKNIHICENMKKNIRSVSL